MAHILKGLLTINGIDTYAEYGAFLAYGKGESPTANYSSLLTPPELKEPRKVEIREIDGVKLPAKLMQRWKAREVTLRFAIDAKDKTEFEERYYGFINFLKDGDDGWLDVHLAELSRTWRMYMRRVTPYEQLTDFNDGVAALFSVVFEEPSPNF
jgi:hypothetical protein